MGGDVMGTYLAFDFGASSGRAVIGKLENNKLLIEEIHRFSNEPVYLGERYVWDFPKLFNEMKIALKKTSLLEQRIKSIGIDTWGVDFGLIDKNDNLIGMPLHYRDKRSYIGLESTRKIISDKELHMRTGNAVMPINSIFQLMADKEVRTDILNSSKSLLFMPDLFSYFLTKEIHSEYTIASTSGLMNIDKKDWDYQLIDKLGLPKNIFNKIIEPGEIFGYLTEDIIKETGLYNVPVIAVGEHDTASAVLAAPFEECAFLSCGTWSLLGIEVDKTIINNKTYYNNFTNEGGVLGKVIFLKNINGLWLLQQLKKTWCEFHEKIDFPDIIEAARKASCKHFILNTNDEELMNSINIIESIKKYCIKNNQGEPKSLGEFAIAIYNGLVNEYNNTIKEMEDILGYKINGINMVGGGIKDELICELTAKVTGKKVIAGPIEATALGNILVQMIASGEIGNLSEARKIVKNSFDTKIYLP